ncbi:MAG: hypothetical protein DRJ40_03885 [Thermoprotei archaeon]|nr:MAG: hypothetical protein DRJ40_03885 [Thermoprotei archaeon]
MEYVADVELLGAGEYRVVSSDEATYRYLSYLVNAVVGNSLEEPVIEVLGSSLRIKFRRSTIVCIGCCTEVRTLLAGREVPKWRAVPVLPNQELEIDCLGTYIAYIGVRGLSISEDRIIVTSEVRDPDERELLARYVPSKYVSVGTEVPVLLFGGVDYTDDVTIEHKFEGRPIIVMRSEQRNVKYLLDPVNCQLILDNSVVGVIPEIYVNLLAIVPRGSSLKLVFSTEVPELPTPRELAHQVKKVIESSTEAARRGAELIRVRINGVEYDVWIEDLGAAW